MQVRVNAPEGASEQDAISYAQTHWDTLSKAGTVSGQAPAPQAGPQGAPSINDIPGQNGKPVAATQQQEAPGTFSPGFFDRALDQTKGMAQAAYAIPRNIIPGIAGEMMYGGTRHGSEQANAEAIKKKSEFMGKYGYTPSSETGQHYLDQVGKAMDESKLSGLGPEMNAGAGGVLAKPASITPGVAKYAAGKAIAESAPVQAIAAGAKEAATGARDAVARGIKITPEMAALNAKAREYGITLRPDQLSDNKFMKILGETFDYVPAAGSKTDANYTAIQKALIKQIGGDPGATVLTPKVFDRAMRKSGTTIDSITRKYELTPTKKFADDLAQVLNDAHKFETAENARIIENHIGSLLDKLQDGPMNGTAFRKFNTDLRRRIEKAGSPDLKGALSDFQDSLLEAYQAGITNPKDKAAYDAARMQYAKAKRIAPIVGDAGGVAPQKIMSTMRRNADDKERLARGTSGDLGDLAEIGSKMKEPRSSYTTERRAIYTGLGFGTAAHPGIAIPALATTYAGANLYNRYGHYLIPPK